MFIDKFDKGTIDSYCNYLKTVAMLSKLSSESDAPYVNSRIAENTFCLITGSENLGRADCSVDAKYGNKGVGIKTFLAQNNKTMQKIAEFNKDASLIRYRNAEAIIGTVSKLRNERLLSTMRIYALDEMIYHCVVREPNYIKICEMSMDIIDIVNINNIKVKNNGNVIYFEDGKNEYSFNISKNTLYKRFDTSNALIRIKTKILDDPYKVLNHFLTYEVDMKSISKKRKYESIILPLFSDKGGRNVPEKSMNQWNAGGRIRDKNEIYIPIPMWIHREFPDFFPDRNKSFMLKLPNGEILSAKICQAGGKALMSNPNLKLGEWLLRDVMNLKEGELVTYKKLQTLGIDSVELIKIVADIFKIDFRPLGSYDDFVEKYVNQ